MKNENKREFEERLVKQLLCEYLLGDNIELACQRLIEKSSPEKRKIFENCLTLFSSTDTRQKIEKLYIAERPSNADELLQLFFITVAEEIFEHDKRQYDFSNKYTGKRIIEITQPDGTVCKSISFKEALKENSEEEVDDSPKENPFVLSLGDGDFIYFTNIGTLTFNTVSPEKTKTVSKFEIKFKASNGNQRIDTVFTNINFKKLSDKRYLRAVLEELLSKKNIEQSNCCGYIGEISLSSGFEDKLKIGKQENYSERFLGSGSRYKFSQNYELIYDFDTLEAVMDYVREHEPEKQEQEQEQKQEQEQEQEQQQPKKMNFPFDLDR